MAVMTYREALNLALREEMKRDDRVDEAVAFAEASPEPPDEWLFTDIYKES